MNIIIGSDHAGYDMKEECVSFLKQEGNHNIGDIGVFSRDSSDYPQIAKKVAESIVKGEHERGVLICGSGIGMSIAANRYNGIRAALCHNPFLARLCRQHNDANIIVMGGRIIGPELAFEMLRVFIETEFDGGRHKRRIDLIDS